MEKAFVDTSAWVALFVRNDQNHAFAAGLFEELKNQRVFLYTSDYVIDETVTTILAKGGHALSVIAGSALFESKIVEIVPVSDYLGKSWVQYKKYKDKSFSFTDVTSFVIAAELGIKKTFTFDDDFSQAGFEVLKTGATHKE